MIPPTIAYTRAQQFVGREFCRGFINSERDSDIVNGRTVLVRFGS